MYKSGKAYQHALTRLQFALTNEIELGNITLTKR